MALGCNPGWSWRRPAGSRWLLPKQRQPRTPAAQPAEAPLRPALQEVSQFMLLERAVEIQYRPCMQEALQDKVNAVADSLRGQTPACSRCSQPMQRHDSETVSWVAPLWTLTRHGNPLSVPRLQRRTPAAAGSAGCGTGTHPWFAGAPAGSAGCSGAVYAGGAISLVAVGRQNQPHERLERSPAIGRVGRPL